MGIGIGSMSINIPKIESILQALHYKETKAKKAIGGRRVFVM